MASRARARSFIASLLVVVVAAGCATSPQDAPEYELTRHEWSGVGALGIMPGSKSTEVVLWALDAKLGAMVGVRKAVQIANMLTLGLWPLAFYGAGLVCVPALGAGVGAAVGAIRKPADEDLEATSQVLFDVITPACLPQVIQDKMLDSAAEHLSARMIVSLDALEGLSVEDRLPSLRDRGLDAVLEVTLELIEVSGAWGTNPDGALRILARYKMIATEDGSTIIAGSKIETATRKEIQGWWEEPSAENPDPTRRLSEMLVLTTQLLAKKIAEDLFLQHPDVGPRVKPGKATTEASEGHP